MSCTILHRLDTSAYKLSGKLEFAKKNPIPCANILYEFNLGGLILLVSFCMKPQDGDPVFGGFFF